MEGHCPAEQQPGCFGRFHGSDPNRSYTRNLHHWTRQYSPHTFLFHPFRSPLARFPPSMSLRSTMSGQAARQVHQAPRSIPITSGAHLSAPLPSFIDVHDSPARLGAHREDLKAWKL
jgi:hypothetical protein